MKEMERRINEIIESSACPEEVWVTVEEEFYDAGINYLFEMGFEEA